MLELIRKYKGIFSVIFVLSAVGMVVSMFGSSGGSGSMGGSGLWGGTAAKVEGEEILTRQLVEGYSRRLQQAQEMMSEQLKGAQDARQREFIEQLIRSQVSPERVLEELIQQKFLISTSENLGIKASPEGIRSLIESNEAFFQNGKFDPLVYRQRVPQPGLYEKELADQTRFMTLSRTVRNSLSLESPSEIEIKNKLAQKRVFESLSVDPTQFPEPKSLSSDEVKKFKEGTSWASASQNYYSRHINEFKSSEKVKASHILVRENEGGLSKIQEIRKEIESGKISFEEAAKKYSSDKSNASKGGDLGYFEKQVMDPAFAEAAFALSAQKSLSEPVKSSFGFHLIKFFDRQAAVEKSLKDVEEEIAPKVALEAAKLAKAKAFVERFKDAAKRPSESEIKTLGLKWSKQPEWSPMDENLGSLGSVDFQLDKILALSKANPYLDQPITLGNSLVMLRWVSNGEAKDHEKEDSKNINKSEVAFEYFLRHRFETLEKNGKIKRSAQVLNELKQATSKN